MGEWKIVIVLYGRFNKAHHCEVRGAEAPPMARCLRSFIELKACSATHRAAVARGRDPHTVEDIARRISDYGHRVPGGADTLWT